MHHKVPPQVTCKWPAETLIDGNLSCTKQNDVQYATVCGDFHSYRNEYLGLTNDYQALNSLKKDCILLNGLETNETLSGNR